jgi:hypothetical protein
MTGNPKKTSKPKIKIFNPTMGHEPRNCINPNRTLAGMVNPTCSCVRSASGILAN